MIRSILTLIMLLVGLSAFAQEEQIEEPEKRHQLTLVLGHTFVPQGVDSDGDKSMLTLASWGFDYNYKVNAKWRIGLHSDFVVENFVYEDNETAFERSRPLASAILAGYKPGKHITVFLGTGGEFSKEETLFLIRAAVEYGVELPDDWELSFSFQTDFKIDAYNAMVVGFGIGKAF